MLLRRGLMMWKLVVHHLGWEGGQVEACLEEPKDQR
jgi:hypothetical protein